MDGQQQSISNIEQVSDEDARKMVRLIRAIVSPRRHTPPWVKPESLRNVVEDFLDAWGRGEFKEPALVLPYITRMRDSLQAEQVQP